MALVQSPASSDRAGSLSGRLKVKPTGEFTHLFADFAPGLLWEHENIGGCTELPFTPQQLTEMKKRYPPRKLEGLEWFNWRPPRRQKQPKETRRAA
jgi:hypothetical protein